MLYIQKKFTIYKQQHAQDDVYWFASYSKRPTPSISQAMIIGGLLRVSQGVGSSKNLKTGCRSNKIRTAYPDPDWAETLAHLETHAFDHLNFILVRLAFQTTVYMLWRERNERKHLKRPRQVPQLVKLIGRTVRNRILSVNYSAKPRLRGLMQRWFATHAQELDKHFNS